MEVFFSRYCIPRLLKGEKKCRLELMGGYNDIRMKHFSLTVWPQSYKDTAIPSQTPLKPRYRRKSQSHLTTAADGALVRETVIRVAGPELSGTRTLPLVLRISLLSPQPGGAGVHRVGHVTRLWRRLGGGAQSAGNVLIGREERHVHSGRAHDGGGGAAPRLRAARAPPTAPHRVLPVQHGRPRRQSCCPWIVN